MAGYLLPSDPVMEFPAPRCKFYFSEFEKDLLRQLYEKNKDVLKWKSGVSPMRVRERGWVDLCTKYNNTAGVRWRNVKQLKKFIENMTQRDKRLARLSGNSLTSEDSSVETLVGNTSDIDPQPRVPNAVALMTRCSVSGLDQAEMDADIHKAILPSLPEVTDSREDSVLGLPIGEEQEDGISFSTTFHRARVPHIKCVQTLTEDPHFVQSHSDTAALRELEAHIQAIKSDMLRKELEHQRKIELMELQRLQCIEKHELKVQHLRLELQMAKFKMKKLERGLVES